MGYNVVLNPIGMVPNTPLSSALGKELHPPIFITLDIHGGQHKIERENTHIYIWDRNEPFMKTLLWHRFYLF